MKFKVKTSVLLYIVCVCFSMMIEKTSAQNKLNIKQYVQLNSIISDGDNAPFGLTANKQGLSSIETSNGYARYGILVDGKIGKKGDWNYSAIMDIATGYNRTRSVDIHQVYADLSWKWLTMGIGAKERFAEMREFCRVTNSAIATNNVNRFFPNLYYNNIGELGTGGLVYSGNSAPIPQFRLEVPQYVDIPGTNSWVKLRGHIAYGIYLDHDFQKKFTNKNRNARYAKNVLYHSKALFMKLGKPSVFPLTMEGGLEMYSQFGGDIYTHASGKIISMPRGGKDFFKAFIPLSGDESTPNTEQANISGNQIGNWHLAFTLHTNPVDVRLYGEHMFDDFSQLFFFEYQSNRYGKREIVYYPWRDIMLGLSVTNKTGVLDFISNIYYEYISTYDQSGAGYNDPNQNYKEQMDGMDNYYNHSVYPGWHYHGMGIGNPLVLSPLYNKNGDLTFSGNRLKAHHVGVNGALGTKIPLMYKIIYTYSENWGTYFIPFDEKKYTTSLSADIIYSPQKSNWLFSLSLAYDKSNYIGNNMGVMLSLVRMDILK